MYYVSKCTRSLPPLEAPVTNSTVNHERKLFSCSPFFYFMNLDKFEPSGKVTAKKDNVATTT